MIVNLNDTTTREIAAQLEKLHVERGEAAQERVMTLIITCTEPDLEEALRTANETSQEHPCRVIALVPQENANNSASNTADTSGKSGESASLLSAQIRFGADAGASEIIVLRPHGPLVRHLDSLLIPLMVPDTPAVAWWPRTPPENPANDQVGRMATERITDAARTADPLTTFKQLRKVSTPADVDLSWTHLTLWRARLAAMLDQPPHEKVTAVTVKGLKNDLSVLLLSAWLKDSLNVPVTIYWARTGEGIRLVSLHRADGDLTLTRCAGNDTSEESKASNAQETSASSDVSTNADQAWMISPNGVKQLVSLPHRSMTDILSEELGRMYPDEVYTHVLTSNFTFTEHDLADSPSKSETPKR